MLDVLNNLRRKMGIDRPIFYTLLGRGWSLISGPITIFLLANFFSPKVQGYYYTFGSVLGLQVFLELGFSAAIVQFASHEFAYLSFQRTGVLEGETKHRSRLISLARLSLKWYRVIALLVFAGLGIAGYLFFLSKHDPNITWTWPWWSLCFATALTLNLLPAWALLEGCNQLSFTCGLRLLNQVLASLVMWAALYFGAELFAGSLTSLSGSLVTIAVIGWCWRGLWREVWRAPQGESISWREEIWPFQWRIAVSSISLYFTGQILISVLFYFQGPVVAGQMGATLQLMLNLHALAITWLATKAPLFGILVAQKNYKELDRLFSKNAAMAVSAGAAGGAALLLALAYVKMHFHIGERFLDLGPTALLLAGPITAQIIYGQGMYLRAHKKEPFMVLSVVNGSANAIAVIVLTYFFGVWGMCIAYASVQLLILVWATAIWKRRRVEWHRDEAQIN
jgi:O-antigen/teichoic acid export membrane protein